MFYGRCKVEGCGWVALMHSRFKAQCASTWHIYEDHPDIWLAQVGDRPPNDPDPRDPFFDMLYGGEN